MRRELKLHSHFETIPDPTSKYGYVPACDLKEGQRREANYWQMWNDGLVPFLLRHDLLRHEGEFDRWIIISTGCLPGAVIRSRDWPDGQKYRNYYSILWELACKGHRARLAGSGHSFIALEKPDYVDDIRSCPINRGDNAGKGEA